MIPVFFIYGHKSHAPAFEIFCWTEQQQHAWMGAQCLDVSLPCLPFSAGCLRWIACGLGLAGSLLVAADGLASGAAESVHGPLASEVQENVRLKRGLDFVVYCFMRHIIFDLEVVIDAC